MHNELTDATFVIPQQEGPKQSNVHSPVTVGYMPLRVTDMNVTPRHSNKCYSY